MNAAWLWLWKIVVSPPLPHAPISYYIWINRISNSDMKRTMKRTMKNTRWFFFFLKAKKVCVIYTSQCLGTRLLQTSHWHYRINWGRCSDNDSKISNYFCPFLLLQKRLTFTVITQLYNIKRILLWPTKA